MRRGRGASFAVAAFVAAAASAPPTAMASDDSPTPVVAPAGRDRGATRARPRPAKGAAKRKSHATRSPSAPSAPSAQSAPPAERADALPAQPEHPEPAPGRAAQETKRDLANDFPRAEPAVPAQASAEPSSESPVSPSAPPESDREARDAVPGSGSGPAHQVGRELFVVSAGIEAGMRHFAYTDGLTANLRPYTLNAAPLVTAGGEIYPLAGAYAVDAGLVLAYAQAFATRSATVDAGTLETRWTRYSAGGRVRVRAGDGGPVFGVAGAYGGELFAIESLNPSASLPSVDYRFVRASADARVPLGRFAVFGDVGYLFVLSAGDVAARFPKSSVGGVAAEVGGAVAIAAGFEARVTASYRRFFYTMNPTPGDGYVAGGALDELSGLQASLAYVF
jgi:hypothetical protein